MGMDMVQVKPGVAFYHKLMRAGIGVQIDRSAKIRIYAAVFGEKSKT